MLVWLDGRVNTRQRPQENFGREIMELFTFGVGNYTEQDVYAAARVFTGWNLRFVGGRDDPNNYYEFQYIPANHDPTEKTFTFPIYSNGSHSIPARPAADGMQDGIDFITALARHPNTARRLARKMWNYFVSEVVPPDDDTIGVRGERLPAERHQHQVDGALHAALARVPEPGQLAHAVLVAGRVRRPRGQGSRLVGVLDRHRAHGARSRWDRCSSSRPTWPAGNSVRDGSRPAPCCRA